VAGVVAIGAYLGVDSSPIKWNNQSELYVKVNGNTHMKIMLEVLPGK
jgi:hypothetical protein